MALSGHDAGVDWVLFFPDGKRAISGGGDGYFRVWDLSTGNELWNTKGHAFTAALTHDAKHLLTYTTNKLTVWALKKGDTTRIGERSLPYTRSAAFSPSGELVVLDRDKLGDHGRPTIPRAWKLELWDAINFKLLREFEGTSTKEGGAGFTQPVAVASDNKTLVLGRLNGKDVSLAVVKRNSGEQVRLLKMNREEWPRDVTFSSNGERVIGRTHEGGMVSWDASSGKYNWRFQNRFLRGGVVSFSPDGKYGVSANGVQSGRNGDMRLILLDTVNGEMIGDLSTPILP